MNIEKVFSLPGEEKLEKKLKAEKEIIIVVEYIDDNGGIYRITLRSFEEVIVLLKNWVDKKSKKLPENLQIKPLPSSFSSCTPPGSVHFIFLEKKGNIKIREIRAKQNKSLSLSTSTSKWGLRGESKEE